jgi:transcriptional regulator with XRE-family HTH domain
MLDSLRSEEILKKVGAKLNKARKAKKLSMRSLASLAGVDYSQIDRIEKGRLNCTILTVIAIADALGVPASKLID